MKVWIARDMDGELYAWLSEPIFSGSEFIASADCMNLDKTDFPKVNNGECYEAEITLGEKV